MSANIGQKHRIHPNSLMNLREPWKAGASANPGGARKGQAFVSEAYKRLLCLSESELAEFKPQNAAEAIAFRQIGSAIFGSDALPSTKEITDRTEGKAQDNRTVFVIDYTKLNDEQLARLSSGEHPQAVLAELTTGERD